MNIHSQVKKLFWSILSTFLFFCGLHAQPYYYFSKTTDDRGNSDIIRVNLNSGTSEVYLQDVGRVLQLFASTNQSRLFIQGRGHLDAINLQSGDRRTIIDGLTWVHNIIDVPQTNRIYISIGDEEFYEKTIVLTETTYDTVSILDNFMSYDPPFLSSDNTKFFRLLPESSGIYFDTYSISDGRKLVSRKRTGSLGNFSFDCGFSDGRRGLAVISIDVTPDRNFGGQEYVVCNPEKATVNVPVPFPFRSEAKLNTDAKYIIIEEVQFINDNDPNTPPEYRPGSVYIFDAQTGKLMQKLTLPPEGKVLLFDNYPDKLFYLTGTDGNFQSIQVSLNVITPVATLIDTLIALTNQSYQQNWIGDKHFTSELANKLDNAKKHLTKKHADTKDSVNCAKEVRKFQKKIDKVYNETTKEEKEHKKEKHKEKFVTVEGWKFLYYNAQYILDRLPALKKEEQEQED